MSQAEPSLVTHSQPALLIQFSLKQSSDLYADGFQYYSGQEDHCNIQEGIQNKEAALVLDGIRTLVAADENRLQS